MQFELEISNILFLISIFNFLIFSSFKNSLFESYLRFWNKFRFLMISSGDGDWITLENHSISFSFKRLIPEFESNKLCNDSIESIG